MYLLNVLFSTMYGSRYVLTNSYFQERTIDSMLYVRSICLFCVCLLCTFQTALLRQKRTKPPNFDRICPAFCHKNPKNHRELRSTQAAYYFFTKNRPLYIGKNHEKIFLETLSYKKDGKSQCLNKFFEQPCFFPRCPLPFMKFIGLNLINWTWLFRVNLQFSHSLLRAREDEMN